MKILMVDITKSIINVHLMPAPRASSGLWLSLDLPSRCAASWGVDWGSGHKQGSTGPPAAVRAPDP